MEISKNDYIKIIDLISKYDNKMELEARIFGKNFDTLSKIDYYKFEHILNNLIFSEENGGYGFTKYSLETTLDIKIEYSDIRLSINNKDDVKLFWLNDEIVKNSKFLKKKNLEKVDINDYNIRISLASEEEVDINDNNVKNFISKMNNKTIEKVYRLKNRYLINNGNIRFDLTSVKMANGKSMKQSNLFKQLTSYEIEIEYIGEKKDTKIIYEDMMKNIIILLKLYNNNSIIKNVELNDVINNYKHLVKLNTINNNNENNPLFIVANPITMHKRHINNIKKDYAVTIKADGNRYLLFINKDGNMYLFDSNINIIKVGLINELWAGTIIEGEYIKENNIFLMYDILYQKENDIRDLPLISKKESRLGYLNLFMKGLNQENNNIQLEIKNYKYSENIFTDIKSLWETKTNYKIDGLIFIPLNDEYPKKGGTWDKLFKWKPEEYNSIDFLIKTDKNELGKDIKYPYIVSTNVYQYKILNLYVGKLFYEDGKRIYKSVEFKPNDIPEQAKILLDNNDKMILKDPMKGKYEELFDDTIVEFVYKKNDIFKWVPIRVRHDKTERYKAGENIFGNNESIALDIWKSITEPLTYDMLSLGQNFEISSFDDNSYYKNQQIKRMPYQNFHNLIIKKNLIIDYAHGEYKLLDLACGKGGDIKKWIEGKYKFVVGIDIDKIGIQNAREYYNNIKERNKININFLWGDTSLPIFPDQECALSKEDKNAMKMVIPSKYIFDVISCQFALHYYFESETKLRGLLQNIRDNLKIDGYFIGTCFDGKKVDKILKNRKQLEGKVEKKLLWKIEKNYINYKNIFGNKITVYVDSIGNKHEEYLVNFEYLENIMKEYNLQKIKIEEFSEIYDKIDNLDNNIITISRMNDIEKEFSFLNNLFIFKKK